MEFSEAVREFVLDCRIRKLASTTIENYTRHLRYLREYLEDEQNVKNIEDVQTVHIKEFLAMMDARKRKPQYINDLLKAFKVFFHYCVQEEYLAKSPADKVHNMKQPKVKMSAVKSKP